jgi:hypothetical protein
LLGTEQFPADLDGYAALLAWMQGFGQLVRVGIEGTGADGAGLARLLSERGVAMVEVDRPDRKTRRFQGKSDPIDAIAAAKTALADNRTGTPKQRDGSIEALRNLRVARRSAVDQRADAQRQIKTLIVTAPDDLRERLRGLPVKDLITTCANLRPDRTDAASPATAAKIALRSLARRHQQLSTEITDLDELLAPLVAAICPGLIAANGVDTDVADQLLVTAGQNHDRLRFRGLLRHALRRRAHPPPPAARPTATASTTAATGKPTPPSTASLYAVCAGTPAPAPTWNDAPRKAPPRKRSSVASSATSPASSTRSSAQTILSSQLDIHRSIRRKRRRSCDGGSVRLFVPT